MKNPTPGTKAGARGEASAWRHDPRPYSAIRFPVPHPPTRPAGALRDILTAAAEHRRHGDHGAAEHLEILALVALRHLTARPGEVRV